MRATRTEDGLLELCDFGAHRNIDDYESQVVVVEVRMLNSGEIFPGYKGSHRYCINDRRSCSIGRCIYVLDSDAAIIRRIQSRIGKCVCRPQVVSGPDGAQHEGQEIPGIGMPQD